MSDLVPFILDTDDETRLHSIVPNNELPEFVQVFLDDVIRTKNYYISV